MYLLLCLHLLYVHVFVKGLNIMQLFKLKVEIMMYNASLFAILICVMFI